jgi:ribose 1,5-bisphosphokinase PhnN
MVASAPRIDPRLRRLARRLARRGRLSTADVHRSVGAYSARIDAFRPSYQQIRIVVNEARLRQAARRATAQLLFEIDMGARPVTDLLKLLKE